MISKPSELCACNCPLGIDAGEGNFGVGAPGSDLTQTHAEGGCPHWHMNVTTPPLLSGGGRGDANLGNSGSAGSELANMEKLPTA